MLSALGPSSERSIFILIASHKSSQVRWWPRPCRSLQLVWVFGPCPARDPRTMTLSLSLSQVKQKFEGRDFERLNSIPASEKKNWPFGAFVFLWSFHFHAIFQIKYDRNIVQLLLLETYPKHWCKCCTQKIFTSACCCTRGSGRKSIFPGVHFS